MSEDFKSELRQKGYKVTQPRLSIFSVFSTECAPMCAEEIYIKVKKRGVDLVTIYRTLSIFENDGIIRRVDLQKESIYYELNKDHHHHLVCKDCGVVEDFQNSQVEKISKQILASSSKFKKVIDHSFEIFGLCKSCTRV